MDFNFSEEQVLLRDSLAKHLADADKTKTSAQRWRDFAELGLTAALIAEADGGLGGGAVDALVILEEFGKALAVAPFVQSAVIGAEFLARGGSAAQRADHLPAMAEGARILAFAQTEAGARYNPRDVDTRATRQGAGFTLSGRKQAVIGAPEADHLIVAARTAGERRDVNGVSLFLLPKETHGVSLTPFETVDGFAAAEIVFDAVALSREHLIGEADGALPLIERVMDGANAALCAEALGAMRAMLDLTLDYAKTRKQFGAAIGSFQVLQHRMVDMFAALEQSVSITYRATLLLDAPPVERARAVSGAKAHVGKAARFLGQSAIQIHGGMGMTEEMRVGHYFRRLMALENQYGGIDHHLRRFADLAD